VACVAGLLVTRSLSAVAVVAGGTALYALLAGGRRGRVALVSGAALLAAAAFLYAPMRARLTGVARAVERGQWNAAFTARAAPWLAAGEMIRAHPLAGVGIGNFGAEYVPARVAAETRFRRRLVLPGMPTNSFAQAHNDYLDLLAGAGIPAGLCIVAAAAILLADLVRRGRRDREAAAAAALLGGSAIAAFAWFPFQIVPTALWILLEAGRAERLRSERAAETTGRAGGRRAAAAAAALAIAGAGIVAAAPEWRKGAALRRLREGEALVLAAARTADPAGRSAMLRDAEEVLGEAQPALPADARPWYLLGSASLLRGDGAEALERYGRSLAIEERPETDLNLSRAYVSTGNAPAAAADAVRAVWLAPNLLRDLPEDARLPVEQHIRRLTRALGRGRGKPPELWKG
jgi:tetratricopeptide (TPR) repeat protein